MKYIILSLVTLFMFFTYVQAEHHEGKNWEERKEKKLKRLNGKIDRLTKRRDCVSSATTKEAFKTCKKEMKEQRKERRMRKRKEKMGT